ncbi:MAG TPA: hypothetical protein VF476_00090 [Chitinophagaceae bacterium]
MLKKCIPFFALTVVLLSACKEKSNDNNEQEVFFPALSFIQSQVAHVDTSIYSIIKLNYIDSIRTDTEYIRREDFRLQAKDFLSLPDISSSKLRKRYKEDKQYLTDLERVLLTYLPVDPEKENIQRQEVLISPDATGDKVNSIIIDYVSNTKDSLVEKKLLWRVDRSFQVTIIKQKPGQPETITTTKVIWNEPDEQ